MLRNRLVRTLFSAVSLAVLCIAFSAGCGDSNKKPETPLEERFQLEIPRIYQYSKIGKRQADGQYVVLNVVLTNLTNITMNIAAGDFEVRNITSSPEERYSLPVEKLMANHFGNEFGTEGASRVLERSSFELHPKIQADRFLIFQIPKAGELESYELYYEPLGLAAPLMTRETGLDDRR
jgi:hypothetical protein